MDITQIAYHAINAVQLIRTVTYVTQVHVQTVILVTIYKLVNVKHVQVNSQIVILVILMLVKYAHLATILTHPIVNHVNRYSITAHSVILIPAQPAKIDISYNLISANSVYLNTHQIVKLVISINAPPAKPNII